MGLKRSLVITDQGLEYFERLYAGYRKMYEDPAGSSPKFIVDTPRRPLASVAEMLDDPLLMLRNELDALRPHLRLRDDMVPAVRVQLGTAQVAAAFGCHMHAFEDSLPASSGPVMKSAADVFRMRKPPLDALLNGDRQGLEHVREARRRRLAAEAQHRPPRLGAERGRGPRDAREAAEVRARLIDGPRRHAAQAPALRARSVVSRFLGAPDKTASATEGTENTEHGSGQDLRNDSGGGR